MNCFQISIFAVHEQLKEIKSRQFQQDAQQKVPSSISKSSIDNAIRKGAEQADNIVLNLSDAAKNKNNGNLSEADIRRYVINRMRDKQNVENVFVLTETKDFLITRKDINKPKATK